MFLQFIEDSFQESTVKKGYIDNGEDILRAHFRDVSIQEQSVLENESVKIQQENDVKSNHQELKTGTHEKKSVDEIIRHNDHPSKIINKQNEIETEPPIKRHDVSISRSAISPVLLTDIFLYPVKSCAAFQVFILYSILKRTFL